MKKYQIAILCTSIFIIILGCKHKALDNKIMYNLEYKIDTLKIENKNYIHELGNELEFFTITASFPVFISDSIPEILSKYNVNIKKDIEDVVLKAMKDYYDKYFNRNYFYRKYNLIFSSDTGTIHERINDFMKVTKLDTFQFSFDHDIFLSENFVSIGIFGKCCPGFSMLGYEPEEYPLCYNMHLYENRHLKPKECFKLREGKREEWITHITQHKNGLGYNYKGWEDYPDSLFIPTTFCQANHHLIVMYFDLPYSYERSKVVNVFSTASWIYEMESLIDLKYVNETYEKEKQDEK